MCEILDQIENCGIQKGMEIMRAEMAEKEASLAEKEAELARKEAQLAQAMELLKKITLHLLNEKWREAYGRVHCCRSGRIYRGSLQISDRIDPIQ